MRKFAIVSFLIASNLVRVEPSEASGGTTGAAFLEIPVGARPAAMGSAYSALASDAYAPIWNPAGLGFLDSSQISAQHLAYLESMHYEYFSVVHPFHQGRALGFSMQYLGTGDIQQTDNDGNATGNFSSDYSAYSFAFGQKISSNLSVGGTAKWIKAKISDVSASAFAADLGLLSQWTDHWRLAATLTNFGSSLKFLNDSDPLPLAGRVGAAYQPSQTWAFSSDAIYRRTGVAGLDTGAHWKPIPMMGLSLGYKTENLKGLSPLAGLTTGMNIEAWGAEFAYAWVPFGALGDSHYFSFVLRFGEAERAKRNLVYLPGVRQPQGPGHSNDLSPEGEQLIELLEEKPGDRVAHSKESQGSHE